MEGKRGSECLLKSVSNIDFNPMLGTMEGVRSSGFYDNSDKIIRMLLAIITATGTVLLPHVAHSFARGNNNAVTHSLEVSMHVILLLAFPMTFGVAALSYPFTIIFFGSQFSAVANIMAVEAIVIIFIGISNAIGTQYLLPTNQLAPYTMSVMLGSLVNIVLNIPLILADGTMGAMIATVLSEFIVSLYQLIKIRHQINIHCLFKETWKYWLSGIIMFLVIKILQPYFRLGILELVLEVGLGVLVYSGVLISLRPRFVLNIFLGLLGNGTSNI